MTRLEKCELLKQMGYTYNKETGRIYGVYSNEIKNINIQGYCRLRYGLLGHHFAWYMVYGDVNFKYLDHINRVRSDNRINNLRSVSNQQNQFNRINKGYSWHKPLNKWRSQIMINGKKLHLGYYDNEEDAKQSYLDAKLKYHII